MKNTAVGLGLLIRQAEARLFRSWPPPATRWLADSSAARYIYSVVLQVLM